jgi:hypothetical protein
MIQKVERRQAFERLTEAEGSAILTPILHSTSGGDIGADSFV